VALLLLADVGIGLHALDEVVLSLFEDPGLDVERLCADPQGSGDLLKDLRGRLS
jgi:hypothetical protein